MSRPTATILMCLNLLGRMPFARRETFVVYFYDNLRRFKTCSEPGKPLT